MAITPLPTPPSRDDPANFAARGDAFLGALPDFATELNDALPTINEAIPASEIAVALVNYKGDYNSATTYLVGQSVTYNGTRFLSKKTNLNITPVDGNDWYELASGAETVVRSILNQSSAITLLASDGGGYLLVSGTTRININLPDATTLVGRTFVIKNLGTYPMFVYNSVGTYLFNLNGNETSAIWASDISTSAGEWSIQEFPAPYADSTLTFGSIATPNVNSLQPVARLSSTKQLVVFNQSIQDSNRIYGVIATNSGGTITVGAPQLISNIDGLGVAAIGLSATSAIVSWRGTSPTTWYACAISLSGDVITAGTEIVIASALADKIKFAYLTSTTALIAGYPTTTTLSAAVLTVSGTTLTSGGLADIGGGNTPSSTYAYGLCTLSSTLCLMGFGNGSNNHLIKTISISGNTVTQNSHVNTGIASGNGNVSLASYSATAATFVYIATGTTDLRIGRVSVSGTTPTLGTTQQVLSNAAYGLNNQLACNVIHKNSNSGYIHTTIATSDGDRIFGFTLAISTYTIGSAISPTTGSSAVTAFRQLENFSDPTAGSESATYTAFHTPLTVGNLQSLTLSGTSATAGTRVGVAPRYLLLNSTGQVSAISSTRAIALLPKYINGVAIGLYAHLINYSNSTPSIIATQIVTSELPSSGSYSSVSLSATQVLLTWNQSSFDIRSAVLTITGDTLSLGSDVQVDAGDGSQGNYWHSITKLTATTALFTWSYRANLYPRSVVLSVSGTTVSVGTAVNLRTVASQERSDCVALDATTVVVSYNTGDSYIALLSISGTTITISHNFRTYMGDTRTSVTSLSSSKFIVSDGNGSLGGMTTGRVGVVANSQITMYPQIQLPSRYGALKFVATSENKGFAYDDYIGMAYAFTIDSANQIVIDKTTTFASPKSGSLLQANSVVPNVGTFAYLASDNFKAFTGKIYSLGAIK